MPNSSARDALPSRWGVAVGPPPDPLTATALPHRSAVASGHLWPQHCSELSSDGGSTYADPGVALADDEALTYNASGTYSIKAALDSTAGVGTASWSITSADDVNIASLPTVTQNASDKTCTFSVTKTGGAWLLQCIVNGGINLATGRTDPALTRSLAIKVAQLCRSAGDRRR